MVKKYLITEGQNNLEKEGEVDGVARQLRLAR
jgi:hypothetical protein